MISLKNLLQGYNMSDINHKNQSADIQDIKRMIPHRYPFLLIDAVK